MLISKYGELSRGQSGMEAGQRPTKEPESDDNPKTGAFKE